MAENEISYKVIGAAIEIHKFIGHRLLEPAYENALAYNLKRVRFINKFQFKNIKRQYS